MKAVVIKVNARNFTGLKDKLIKALGR